MARKKKKKVWKSEAMWIEFLAQYLNDTPEVQKRFDWLRGPTSNRHLKLDAYFPKYNLAFEYNGIQHYQYVRRFHKSKKKFEYCKMLDAHKYKTLMENKVNLLIVKHDDDPKDIISCLNALLGLSA